MYIYIYIYIYTVNVYIQERVWCMQVQHLESILSAVQSEVTQEVEVWQVQRSRYENEVHTSLQLLSDVTEHVRLNTHHNHTRQTLLDVRFVQSLNFMNKYIYIYIYKLYCNTH